MYLPESKQSGTHPDQLSENHFQQKKPYTAPLVRSFDASIETNGSNSEFFTDAGFSTGS